MSIHLSIAALAFSLICAGLADDVATSAASAPPTLRAKAAGAVSPPLVIDEKQLRKLVEVVNTRMKQRTDNFRINYTVTTKGEFYYDTQSLDIILGDENSRTRRIIQVQVEARTVPPVAYEGPLSLDQRKQLEESLLELQATESPRLTVALAETGGTYSVSGANRDWVLSTQIDLSERLDAMRGQGEWIRYIVPSLGAVGGFLAMALAFAIPLRYKFDRSRRAEAPNHTGTSLPRYMFISRDPTVTPGRSMAIFQLSLVAGVASWLGAKSVTSYLFPLVIFLIGEQIVEFERITALRSYLLTGVIATLIVGFVSSVVANLATRSKA